MFDELRKYKNQGHFFFVKGKNLAEVSKDVPELPGVYYMMRLAKGSIDLVFIGQSNSRHPTASSKEQSLREGINYDDKGINRQHFLELKLQQEHINGLDIYWFVTMDDQHSDSPESVKELLIQRYREVYGRLPEWNAHH